MKDVDFDEFDKVMGKLKELENEMNEAEKKFKESNLDYKLFEEYLKKSDQWKKYLDENREMILAKLIK